MSFVIDYFAVLGKKGVNLTPVGFPRRRARQGKEGNIRPVEIWSDAITDISMIFDDECLPDDTWEVLGATIDGYEICRPHIVIRRRKHSTRLDHISAVKQLLLFLVLH